MTGTPLRRALLALGLVSPKPGDGIPPEETAGSVAILAIGNLVATGVVLALAFAVTSLVLGLPSPGWAWQVFYLVLLTAAGVWGTLRRRQRARKDLRSR